MWLLVVMLALVGCTAGAPADNVPPGLLMVRVSAGDIAVPATVGSRLQLLSTQIPEGGDILLWDREGSHRVHLPED